ncbi:MAG: A/G-specific adenine glycosylase [Chlamydiae bacterium CG10_big_fil_rev_8_21_14_0_10_42_34]|nr:MAG: A/G-specific adenine glycosylase [Chlamydiae bacterium CG10_big_fil_rev_8_21_14_0_10_42_34]
MNELHDWFCQNKRDFPWRHEINPYKVWVSEVMLQQTRASVVIPYFERWLRLFPDVKSLAAASIDEVIKAWEGLGYYSRARNLYFGAKQVVEQFGGIIPSDTEALESICGIGPYTLGAILSFGFRKRAVAVDGNVTRVLTRLFSIEENICKQPTKRKITNLAESVLDVNTPWVTTEALIELGATVCTPRPKCEICPLEKRCLGRDKALSLPIKNGDKQIVFIQRAVALIEDEGRILVKKGEAGKVMADLYELPYFEMGEIVWTQKMIGKAIEEQLGLSVKVLKKLQLVTHTFTRYKARLHPFLCGALEGKQIEGYQWVSKAILSDLPFSSGHRRILSQ